MFENLKIPDSSWILNNKIQSLPGAAMNGLEEATQMKDLFNKTQMGSIQLNQAQRGQQAQIAQDALMKQFPLTPPGQQQVAAGLAQKGFGPEALATHQTAAAWDRTMKEIEEKDRQTSKERLAAGARYIKTLPPESQQAAWDYMKQKMVKDGYDASDMPPQPTKEVLDMAEKATMSQKDIEAGLQSKAELEELKRWHDMQAGISANKPSATGLTTVWGENGLEVVDRINRTSSPVHTTRTGGQLPPRAPQTPVAINTALLSNENTMKAIADAVAELKRNPKSTGLIKGIAQATPLGSTIVDKYDRKGVNARAGVADVGSLTYHDRSGAAVTISESPRLRPFIPEGYKKADVNIKNLQRMYNLIEAENKGLKATYPSAGPKSLGDPTYRSPAGERGASGEWDNAPPPAQPAGQIWSRVPKK